MFVSKLGKPLWGGEQAGAEERNSLKSISDTEPENQLLEIFIVKHLYMPHLRDELQRNSIKLLVRAVLSY